MKLSKSELKSIVKECLLEILSEGIGSKNILSTHSRDMSLSKKISEAPVKRIAQNNSIREAIKREASGDRIMEEILADTAASTLPKFMQAGEGKHPIHQPTGLVEQVVSQTNPEDIFGEEAMSKWADLAFMNSPKGNK